MATQVIAEGSQPSTPVAECSTTTAQTSSEFVNNDSSHDTEYYFEDDLAVFLVCDRNASYDS